jgi:hypothetical protein
MQEPNEQVVENYYQMERQNEPRAVPTLPQWRGLMVVQAAEIVDILPAPVPGVTCLELRVDGPLGETGRVQVEVREDDVRGDAPKLGDYYVRYENGRAGWMPGDLFLSKYSKIEPVEVLWQSRRQITSHEVNEANRKLRIDVLDDPSHGGANHLYQVSGFSTESNPSCPFVARYGKPSEHTTLLFQQGGIAEVGVNGLTHEALLAVIIDRMKAFQSGPYACDENRQALTHLEYAVRYLHLRTSRRLQQGVEGTQQGS